MARRFSCAWTRALSAGGGWDDSAPSTTPVTASTAMYTSSTAAVLGSVRRANGPPPWAAPPTATIATTRVASAAPRGPARTAAAITSGKSRYGYEDGGRNVCGNSWPSSSSDSRTQATASDTNSSSVRRPAKPGEGAAQLRIRGATVSAPTTFPAHHNPNAARNPPLGSDPVTARAAPPGRAPQSAAPEAAIRTRLPRGPAP